MKKIAISYLLLFPLGIFSQDPKISPIKADQIDIALRPSFVNGYQWSDTQGTNYTLLLKTKPYEEVKGSQFFSVDLRVITFNSLNPTEQIIAWEHRDSETKCFADNDLTVEFIKDSFSVTDLNKNGINEVWVIYKMSCRTDVSPSKMVLVMYEGKSKYVVSGHQRVKYNNGGYIGGESEIDKNLKNAPKEFKDCATKLWDKFIDEVW